MIFEHTSHTGIAAQMSSPEDRAHYDYVLAKLFAKMGDSDHSLQYLRAAMENGYAGVNNALTDPEFAELAQRRPLCRLDEGAAGGDSGVACCSGSWF